MPPVRQVLNNDDYGDEEHGLTSDGEGSYSADDEKFWKKEEDILDLKTVDLEEDCYGLAIASLVRDGQRLTHEMNRHKNIRRARMFCAFVLVGANIFLQIFFMYEIKKFVTARAVHDIREAYDAFERKVYQGHVTVNSRNMSRGIDGMDGVYYGGQVAFDTLLTDDEKESACRIPLSEPNFFFCIIYIWSLTVISEIKKTWLIFSRLILHTDNAETMANATDDNADGDEVIERLTIFVKVIIVTTILLPRLFISSVLLWLGCRWLTATNDFADLLLNAVALEFVLLLKELLYHTLVPNRNKHDLINTKICLEHEAGPPNACDFLGSFGWAIVTLVWVFLYVYYLQHVLPDYQFDVQSVCEEWKRKRYAV